jgi:hypothetical protein
MEQGMDVGVIERGRQARTNFWFINVRGIPVMGLEELLGV